MKTNSKFNQYQYSQLYLLSFLQSISK